MLEIPIFLTILGIMIEAGSQGLVHVRKSLGALEGESVATGARVAMMEYRAVAGEWPQSNFEARFADTQGSSSRLTAVTIRYDGAVDVTFSDADAAMTGCALSVRAQPGDMLGAAPFWSCRATRPS